VVKPTATTTYTLTCGGAGGSIARSVTDTVTPPAPTLTLSSSKTTFLVGDSSTLSWTSTNDTLCTASGGWSGSQPLNGSQVVKPTATTTYTLTCGGAGGSIARSVTDTVTTPAAPTLSLTSSKTRFIVGDSSTLSWTSTNDTLCTASGGWTGTQPLTGSQVVKPTTTTVYTLTCGGAGGSIAKSVTDTVVPPPPPTLALTSSKTTFVVGDSSTLTWTSTNDTLCTASGGWSGTRSLNGSQVVKPTTTTTYTLTCAGAGGSIARSVTDTVTPPAAPTLTLTSSKTRFIVGDSSTLSWTSSNDTLCTASDGWSGTRALNGSQVVKPTVTTVYTLTCEGEGGNVAKSVTDTVAPPPPTLALTSSKTTFVVGDSSTLTWTSTNDTLCTASGGWSGTRALNGSQVVKPTVTTVYTLTCEGEGGNVAKSVTDTVTLPPAPTLTLTSSKTTFVVGDSSTLSWTSSNDTLCTASGGWTGPQPLSGSQVVKPTVTTAYTLTCEGEGGNVAKSVTDTVTAAPPPPPPTLALTSSKTTFVVGDSSTLSWTSSNDTLCTASGGWSGSQPLSGSQVVKPTTTTAYSLTCEGEGGNITKSVTDTVTPPPPPTLTLTSSKTTFVVGDSSTLSWASTNDTLCTASGGWTGTQPLNGSQVVKPTVTTVYSLTCEGAGGNIARSVTDTVTAAPPPPPPTLALTSSKTTFVVGDSSTLTWTSSNDTLCMASGGWTGTQPLNGSQVVKPTATTVYTLTCDGPGGSIAKSVTDTVTAAPPPPAPTLTFSSSKTTFFAGDSSTLSWASTNATTCTASGGWVGVQSLTGTLVVKPTVTTTYTLGCDGPGGSINRSVTDTVTTPPPPPPPPPNGTYAYPLRASGRSLVDQNGQPFLYMGDAPWSLIVQLTDEDAESYFATRQSQGFTAAMINVIEHKFSAHPPSNVYNQRPFTGANFATPNEAYFQHVDAVVRSAAAHGIVLMLDALYLGASCSNEGWAAELAAAPTASLQSWGVYLGTRYKNFPNIIWQIGGDVDPNRCSGAITKLTALVNGIRSVDQGHPFITHNNAEQTVAGAWGNATWITINGVYTYSNTLYNNVTAAVAASPIRPVILLETKYENETESHVTQQQLRSQIYWTLLSGGLGNVYGNCPVWFFDMPSHGAYCNVTGWQAQLTSQGATNMKNAAKLFNARHWPLLARDANHTTLTAGFGSGTSLATTAAATDGSSIIAYLPTSRTVTVNSSTLAGATVSVRWYNPATGAWTAAGSFAKGTMNLTPPGSGDWVLVIDADQFGLPTP
jgi:hypothetical protein